MYNISFLDLHFWYDLPLFIQYLFIIIIGLCAGSFINVVVYRLPIIFENQLQQYIINEQNKLKTNQELEITSPKQADFLVVENNTFSLSKPASKCSQCGYKLKWYDNIPVVSWIFLQAKCRKCSSKISIQYPIVELISGLGAGFCYYAFNHTIAAFMALIFFWLILTIIILDAKTQLLPDELSQPLIFIGLFCSIFNIFINSTDAIIGFLVPFTLLWGIAYLFKLIKGYQGLGEGDPYLLGGIGAWCGVEVSLYAIFYASISGIVFVILRKIFLNKPVENSIAFGPFIGIFGLILFFQKYFI